MSMSSSKWSKSENCCYYRSRLEKILIASVIIIIFVALLLLILLLVPLSNLENNKPKCSTTECILRASQLAQTIDSSVDPCQNFYQFSCGKLLERAHGDEKLGPFFQAAEKSKRGIYEMYNQSINSSDHRMVKKAKKFYRACLNLPHEDGSSSTIKEMLQFVGEWPVIKGNFWNDTAFEWTQAAYKLRQLGYFHGSLIQLSVEIDPNNGNKQILQVSLPKVELIPSHTEIQEKIQLMVETAVQLGAKSETALIEMTEMYDFMFDLQRVSSWHGNGEPYHRVTIAEFQRKYKKINWLEFINKIVGPSVKIFRDDYILFPLSHTIHRWFNFLAKVPKRTLANYIIWKALEDLLPYIKNTTLAKTESESIEVRSDFCIAEIRRMYHPSPIDVLYLRQNLPQEKVKELKSVIENIKFEFLRLLYEIDLVNSKEKLVAMERIKQMNEVIGAPINYLDDEILDNLDVDMVEWKRNDSLSLVLQVKRNFQSWMFGEMYNSVLESRENQWTLQTVSLIGDYFYEDNLLALPATLLQDDIFDLKQPMYKNYASMGIIMSHHFLYTIENPTVNYDDEEDSLKQTSKLFTTQSECLYNQTDSLNTTRGKTSNLLLYQSLGLKASYEAYKKLDKMNNLEILSINYTIYQMFWISAASYFCQPSTIYSEERQLFPFMVLGITSNNDDFASDFNCHLDNRDKCKLL